MLGYLLAVPCFDQGYASSEARCVDPGGTPRAGGKDIITHSNSVRASEGGKKVCVRTPLREEKKKDELLSSLVEVKKPS